MDTGVWLVVSRGLGAADARFSQHAAAVREHWGGHPVQRRSQCVAAHTGGVPAACFEDAITRRWLARTGAAVTRARLQSIDGGALAVEGRVLGTSSLFLSGGEGAMQSLRELADSQRHRGRGGSTGGGQLGLHGAIPSKAVGMTTWWWEGSDGGQ